jgi:hypothetical protein
MKGAVISRIGGDPERARKEARRLLESHAPTPMPPRVDATLERIASAAELSPA